MGALHALGQQREPQWSWGLFRSAAPGLSFQSVTPPDNPPRTPTRLQSLRATAPVRRPSKDATGRCCVQSACVGGPRKPCGCRVGNGGSLFKPMVGRVGDWSPPSLSRSAGACGWRRYPQKEIRSKPVSSEELKDSPQPQKECKEVLSSRTPSVILSQKSDFKKSPSCLPSCTWLRWRRCLRRTLTLLQCSEAVLSVAAQPLKQCRGL
ncbi:uncharacterized protein LOC130678885 isoform X2 [Manis pentadactyla]|uniref:uncharacterized protein LOC130678885 isoform X2 n=1 Tax=Manis pentadactyla TaxID=143292 RepID=UPI00255CEE83|nr:uncharacterized protein LOC130678885 isoform X2 [Manis pentadactyla]